ncbi:uncharacterized protein JN550_011805 [Neoarthrinium moseri]|uniref:uncharacterized protein n=1 Tax=Neoarthrinium moseri TaxID=1658444 RepID=UPI001FDC13B8|nr:uncharacterized protein JN550_011805 [Neoarthrinium moseri]KAI1859886.1 hypothetical protein JN550_011805 [Neoarthrinium moseri]
MAVFKNVVLIGATGAIGSVILEALLKESVFEVTILQRASSQSKLSPALKSIKIDDGYPTEALISTFQEQDVILNCMTSMSVADQFRMIDAAIAAGVKRYVPSEYGLNNLRSDAQAVNAVFRDKDKVQEYLRLKVSEEAIEWMSISCGMWIKWSMINNFLGMHVSDKKFVFWDDGQGLFSCTTEENTAAGVVQALKTPGLTKNTNVFLSDFAISQKQLLSTIERIQGAKYATETVDSHALIQEKKEAVRAGDGLATFALIETGFVTGRFDGHLEKEGKIMNEKLGQPPKTVDEAVENALKALNAV